MSHGTDRFEAYHGTETGNCTLFSRCMPSYVGGTHRANKCYTFLQDDEGMTIHQEYLAGVKTKKIPIVGL